VAVTQGYLERVGIGRNDLVPALGTELELGAPRFLEGGGGVWARWTRAVIVGVVAQDAGTGDILAPIPMVRADQAFGDGADSASGGEPSPTYAAVIVEADSLDQVPPVRGEIERIGYSTTASDTLITNVERYIHVIEIVLSAIGIIALAIAGLGIADALFAAVRERRREIGVLKAIGARDRDVRRLFLVEAGLVGAVGGAVGTGMGWASARVVAAAVNAYLAKQGLAPVPVRFPTLIVAGCVLGSACLALLAGVVPAARASRLPASEVMAEG
jgi:hypothetical protein